MSEGEDISQRVDYLTQQHEEKEAIIDGISDALMLLDAKTYEILDVNEGFLNSYGLSRDAVLGKRCYEVTHHLSRPCHHVNGLCPCPLEDSVTSGNLSHAEHVHKNSDGKILYFEITTYPLKDASGQVTRIIHLSSDITLWKRLELELR